MKTKLHSLFIWLALLVSVHPTQAQPTLGIAPAGNQTVLFWPTWAANYILQSTTNLVSPTWVAVTDATPVTAFTVTNTSPTRFFRLYQDNSNTTNGMALIPEGAFIMGDTVDPYGQDLVDPAPVIVTVSGFYMDVNLVSYSQWQSVYSYATNAGYSFDYAGSGKAANHPVQTIDWYDMVKWCNARSLQAGLTPVYYTDTNLTQVYMNGQVDISNSNVNWTANGFRLPTEAEWEKAARGGLSGLRFPWGNTISESQANYNSDYPSSSYDLGPNGFNATGLSGGSPYTSPVGSFAANAYGLYDMAGNVQEWCWDEPAAYAGGNDPHGPGNAPGTRMSRGGDWSDDVELARCARRNGYSPDDAEDFLGFRCVRRQ